MGTARVDEDACLAHGGVPCRACADVCPVPDVIELRLGPSAGV